MEKFPSQSNSPKAEVSIENQPSHHNIEDVVVHARDLKRLCIEDPNAAGCSPELLNKEIDSSEVSGTFKNYEAHKIVTLDDISDSVAVVRAHLEEELSHLHAEDEEVKFISERLNLIKTRDQTLQEAVRRYVGTLSLFFNIKKQRIHLEREDFEYKMEDIDKRRRSAHNSLIETLVVYSRIINELKEYGLLDGFTIEAWGPGVDITRSLSAGSDKSVVIFSDSSLKDRDLIKDWAVSAYLHDSLMVLMAAQEKTPPDEPVAKDD